MIAVNITVVTDDTPDTTGTGGADTRGRVIDATVSATVPVAELLPHLVDARPGEHWQLSGPTGVLRPEHGLDEAGVRPGERLTLARATVPAPPADTVGQLSTPVPGNPAARVAAVVAAAATLVVPPFSAGAPVWHPLEVTDRARSVLDGAGDPGGLTATACTLVTLLAAVAALLGFSAGVQVNVLTGCVLAACAVWRPGPERVVTVLLALAAAVNVLPGLTALLGVVVTVVAGQLALGVAGVPLPRIPATGLFAAATATGGDRPDGTGTDGGVARAHATHASVVVVACVLVLVGVVRLIPPGAGAHPDLWTVGACLAVAVTGLSARGCRPVHAVTVTVTATVVLCWTLLHCPGPWPVLALLPVALPAVRITSPVAGRGTDVLETVAFAVAVPLLIGTTGVFDLVRGIG